jgi:hypothetical protein
MEEQREEEREEEREEGHEEEHEEQEVQERDENLLLTAPQPLTSGRRSSVCIDPERSVAVMVYDNGLGRLFSKVGTVTKRSMKVKWSTNLNQYGVGKQPSIALIYLAETLYILEIHRAVAWKKSHVKVGVVEIEGRKRIDWDEQEEELLCSVVKPKISAANDGTFAIVHEAAYTRKKMKYHFGRLERREQDGRISLSLSEVTRCLSFDDRVRGVEPDLAISGNRIVVVYRSGDLRCHMGVVGDIHNHQNPIQWNDRNSQEKVGKKATTGLNPSIDINGRGYVVLAYQTRTRYIHYAHGHIKNNSIVWHHDDAASSGEYPSMTLADDGFVIETHKAWLGHGLFYASGKLLNQGQNNPQEEEAH